MDQFHYTDPIVKILLKQQKVCHRAIYQRSSKHLQSISVLFNISRVTLVTSRPRKYTVGVKYMLILYAPILCLPDYTILVKCSIILF